MIERGLDPGEGILVEGVAGCLGFLKPAEGLFQFVAFGSVAEIADDLGNVFELWRRLRAVAEGHDAEGNLVVQLVLGDGVENGPHHVEALVDVGFHGNGRVDDHCDARARDAVVLGVFWGVGVWLVPGAAGIDGGDFKELGPLERRVHFQDGHQVEAVARDGTLRVVGLHGEDGQIRRGVALLRGLGFGAEFRKAARQVFRLADIHDGLVVLEEQDGLAL